jgi:aldehyde:ferredoxin oxidoreductase
MNHHDTLVLLLLLTIILLIAEIARIAREIEENGGQITAEELQLAAQRIYRNIREYLQKKS